MAGTFGDECQARVFDRFNGASEPTSDHAGAARRTPGGDGGSGGCRRHAWHSGPDGCGPAIRCGDTRGCCGSGIESAAVTDLGRQLRFHPRFKPAGTNVNFAKVQDRRFLFNRTYERGVEDETLACGTGCVATVLIAALKGWVESPCRVMTRGGEELVVYFTRNEKTFSNLFLEGPVRIIFTGRLGPDALA